MSRASRDKGCRGELEACEALAHVWPGLQRTYHQARSGSDAPDIDGPGCPVFIEVKRQETLNVHQAIRQAADAASRETGYRPPIVVHKRNRGEWLITLRVIDLPVLPLASSRMRMHLRNFPADP